MILSFCAACLSKIVKAKNEKFNYNPDNHDNNQLDGTKWQSQHHQKNI